MSYYYLNAMTEFEKGGKGHFCDLWSALNFSSVMWNGCFSPWIVISTVAMKHDFAKLFFVKQENKIIFNSLGTVTIPLIDMCHFLT